MSRGLEVLDGDQARNGGVVGSFVHSHRSLLSTDYV